MAATAEGNALTPEERQAMCRGKKRFAKEGQAIDAVVKMQRRGRGYRLRVYKCPVCSGYHWANNLPTLREPAAAA